MAGIAASYVSATSFTLVGDQTGIVEPGRRLRLDCGVDGYKLCTVVSAVFGDVTTVVISGQEITSNLSEFQYGVVSPSSLPKHSHSIQELPDVPRILYGTSETPPDATGLPDGTIYIRIGG